MKKIAGLYLPEDQKEALEALFKNRTLTLAQRRTLERYAMTEGGDSWDEKDYSHLHSS